MFGKIIAGAVAAGLAIMLIPADPAEARTKKFRFHPYYGGLYIAPRYPRPRVYYDFYEPPPFDQYEFEQGYYEPDYYAPPPRKLKKKKAVKAPAASAKKKTAVASVEKQVETTKQKPAAQASSGKLIACDKAQSIVGGYGFEGVKASDCDGQLYAFTATRGGKPYTIKLSSVSGELTEVKKIE